MNEISYQNLIMYAASVPRTSSKDDDEKDDEPQDLFTILGKAQKK